MKLAVGFRGLRPLRSSDGAPLPDGESYSRVRVERGTLTVLSTYPLAVVRWLVFAALALGLLFGVLAATIVHSVSTDPPRAEVTDASPQEAQEEE